MLVGVSHNSHKFYMIIIISRFIHIISCVRIQCCQPLIMILSCFLRQVRLNQQFVLFVALHVARLVLLVLLEDNIWTEGMSCADVTCGSPPQCHLTVDEVFWNATILHTADMIQPSQSVLSEQGVHNGKTSTRQDISVGYFVLP